MRSRTFQFRLYCDASRWYYINVEIHPTKALMLRAYRKLRGKQRGDRRMQACFCGYRKVRNGRKTGCVGKAFFHVRSVGSEAVSHEMCHATIEYAVWKGITVPQPDPPRKRRTPWCARKEEQFCRVLGDLTGRFWTHWWKAKAWRKAYGRKEIAP